MSHSTKVGGGVKINVSSKLYSQLRRAAKLAEEAAKLEAKLDAPIAESTDLRDPAGNVLPRPVGGGAGKAKGRKAKARKAKASKSASIVGAEYRQATGSLLGCEANDFRRVGGSVKFAPPTDMGEGKAKDTGTNVPARPASPKVLFSSTSGGGKKEEGEDKDREYQKAKLIIYRQEGGNWTASLSDISRCRTLLAQADPMEWAEVIGWTLQRPVHVLRTFFGMDSKQLYGPALRDILGKDGKVLVPKGTKIPTGGWEIPYSEFDSEMVVGQIRFPEDRPMAKWSGKVCDRYLDVREKELTAWLFVQLTKMPGIGFAYVSGHGMNLISPSKVHGKGHWCAHTSSHGITVKDDGKAKVHKRTKVFGSPTAVRAYLNDNQFKVHVLTPEETMDLAMKAGMDMEAVTQQAILEGKTPDQVVAEAFDGISIIRKDAMMKLIAGCWSGKKGRKARATRKWLESESVWTTRGFVAGGRFLKTVCLIVDNPIFDADMIVHPINFKKEVLGRAGRVELFMFPNSGKDSVNLDLQTAINTWGIFTEDQLTRWAQSDIIRNYHEVISGETADTIGKMAKLSGELVHEGEWEELQSVFLQYRWKSAEFCRKGTGRTLQHSPCLAENIFKAGAKLCAPNLAPRLDNEGKPELDAEGYEILDPIGRGADNIHIPIPGGVYWQILPNIVAVVGGIDIPPLGEDNIFQDDRHQIAFVATMTALKSRRNHGGGDWDDKYSLFQIMDTNTGILKILAVRSPNSLGEWSVYSPVGSFTNPSVVFELTEGNEYQVVEETWPSANLSALPPQVSTLLDAGLLSYSNGKKAVPSKVANGPINGVEYDRQSLQAAIMKTLGGNNPGRYLNALMACGLFRRKLPSVLPFSAEQVVDAAAQQDHDHANLGAMIYKASEELLAFALASNPVVDRTFWCSRGFWAPKGVEVILQDGWITRIQRAAGLMFRQMTIALKEWIVKHAAPCDSAKAVWEQVRAEDRTKLYTEIKDWRKKFAKLGDEGTKEEKETLNRTFLEKVTKEMGFSMLVLQAALADSKDGRAFRRDGTLSDGIVFADQKAWAQFMAELTISDRENGMDTGEELEHIPFEGDLF